MPRSRRVIDIRTGAETVVPYTPGEEAEADALAAAEAARDRDAEAIAAALQAGALKALAAFVFGLAKGTIEADPTLTPAQFRQQLKALMRNGA